MLSSANMTEFSEVSTRRGLPQVRSASLRIPLPDNGISVSGSGGIRGLASETFSVGLNGTIRPHTLVHASFLVVVLYRS